jgi:intermembrane space import and assembly protein 40
MQNCFREYPEVYGSELDSDADDDEDDMAAPAQPQSEEQETPTRSSPTSTSAPDADSSNAQSQSPSGARDNDHAASAKGKFSGEPSSKPPTPEKKTGDRNPIYDATGDMSSTEKEQRSKKKPQGSSAAERAKQAKKQVENQEPVSESERLVPKAAHDAQEKGTGVLERK